jgi:hypothetical protein
MTTFANIVDEVQSYLRSFVRDQELSTHLTADITNVSIVIPVADTSVLSRGRIQIDDEIIWLDSADRQGTTATAPPYGRGMDNSAAAAHTAGTRIVVQPLYPRVMVKSLVNQAITTIGAQLYGVKEVLLDPSTSFIYEIPAEVQDVLSVQMTDITASGDVFYLRDWQLDRNAPSTTSTTGKSLYIYDGAFRYPEQIVVKYSVDPLPLVENTDLFTASLLPATSLDCVILLAASRLLATAEAYNLQTRAVEANTMDSKVQPGIGLSQSKYLYGLYSQRISEERLRLLQGTVQRSHYQR